MKRKIALLLSVAALSGATAALDAIGDAGPASLDLSYTALRDGAQGALSATFSLSAAVTQWIEESRACPEAAAQS
jgi:hypothetical protein